jgi:hypothetical protein
MALELTPASNLYFPQIGSSIVSSFKQCCFLSSELELYEYTSPLGDNFMKQWVAVFMYIYLYVDV